MFQKSSTGWNICWLLRTEGGRTQSSISQSISAGPSAVGARLSVTDRSRRYSAIASLASLISVASVGSQMLLSRSGVRGLKWRPWFRFETHAVRASSTPFITFFLHPMTLCYRYTVNNQRNIRSMKLAKSVFKTWVA